MLELAMMGEVIGRTAAHQNVPTVENVQYHARCNNREFKLTEENGRLILIFEKRALDLSETAFSKSYGSGSYIGRFTLACGYQRDNFTYSFFGVEVPQAKTIIPAAGSITLNAKLEVIEDHPISRRELDLVDFNKRRLQRIFKK